MTYKIDSKATREQIKGSWLRILPIIDNRLKPAIDAAGTHVPCPLGTGNKDGFRIPLAASEDGHAFHNQLSNNSLSDGFKLLMWLNDWSFYEALKAVHDCLNGHEFKPSENKTTAKAKIIDLKPKRRLVSRWVRESSTSINKPAIAYFNSRGLPKVQYIKSEALRYHNGIPFLGANGLVKHRETGELITTPAILCGMRSKLGIAGLCVIRLTCDGEKAGDLISEAVSHHQGVSNYPSRSKQLLGVIPSMTGSSFRLGNVGSTWSVGEGVETMLAVSSAFCTESVAAATTASLLAGMDIPDHVENLRIFADKDWSGRGEEAANELMEREKNKRNVSIYTPKADIQLNSKGIDWLESQDELFGLAAKLLS